MVCIIRFLASTTRIKAIPKGSSQYISTNLINAKMLVLQQPENRRKYSDFFATHLVEHDCLSTIREYIVLICFLFSV